jgi:HEAT repeat protein
MAIVAAGLTAAEIAPDIGKLKAELASSERDSRREASHQLLKLGPGAKAALPELIKALDDPDRQVWAGAVGAIAAIGPDAKDAIPRLLEAFSNSKARDGRQRDRGQVLFRSAYALTCIGDAARPALIEALKSEETEIRLGAAKALGGMGPRAKDAVPALIENLGHADDAVRVEVTETLGAIGADAVGPLAKFLASPDPRLRAGSARSLGAIGAAAAAAGSILIERAKNDTEVSVRAAALAALPKLGLAQEQIVPALVVALRDDREELRSAAINGLLLVRQPEKAAVPAVASLLADKNPAVIERAVYVLGRYGPASKAFVPALVSTAARTQPVGAVYADALIEIGSPVVPELLKQVEKLPPTSLNRDHWITRLLKAIGVAAVPELTKALESPSPSIRLAALNALGELGGRARDARGAIGKLATDAQPLIRGAAISALVSLKSDSEETRERIHAAMLDPVPAVRLQAVTAAGSLGPAARGLAGSLGRLIDDPDPAVRAAAVKAVGATGTDDPQLAAKIVARLDDPTLRSTVIETLGKLGSASAGAAPKLIAIYPKADKSERLAILGALGAAPSPEAIAVIAEALKDPDAAIRTAALRARASSQPIGDALLADLTGALSDPQLPVRRAAVEALAQLGDKQPEKLAPALGPMVAMLANGEDRSYTLEGLRQMHVRDQDALAQALAIRASEVRAWACERVGKLGRQGRPLAEKVEPLLADKNDYVRRAARKALDQIKQ